MITVSLGGSVNAVGRGDGGARGKEGGGVILSVMRKECEGKCSCH